LLPAEIIGYWISFFSLNQGGASEVSNSSASTIPALDYSRYVNVSFALSGKQLPADHGYLLYSAISRGFPALHSVDLLGLAFHGRQQFLS
jgi:hypothetical protein